MRDWDSGISARAGRFGGPPSLLPSPSAFRPSRLSTFPPCGLSAFRPSRPSTFPPSSLPAFLPSRLPTFPPFCSCSRMLTMSAFESDGRSTDVSALGEFEQVVLLSILRLGDEAYAVSIRDEILRCTGRDVSRGSVYITLDRLETKGYLQSRLADPTPERGGRVEALLRAAAAGRRGAQGQPARAGRALARPRKRAGQRMTPRPPMRAPAVRAASSRAICASRSQAI